MTKHKTQAEILFEKPTSEVTDARIAVRDSSATSESMSIVEFPQEDGSTLVVSSFQGGESETHVFGSDDTVIVQVPSLSDSPSPTGIDDDGIHRDEEDTPIVVTREED